MFHIKISRERENARPLRIQGYYMSQFIQSALKSIPTKQRRKCCADHTLARVPVQERLAAEHAGEPFFV